MRPLVQLIIIMIKCKLTSHSSNSSMFYSTGIVVTVAAMVIAVGSV